MQEQTPNSIDPPTMNRRLEQTEPAVIAMPKPKGKKRRRTRREPAFSEDGQPRLVFITTRTGDIVTLYAHDFCHLMALGFSDQWQTVAPSKGSQTKYMAFGSWPMTGKSMLAARFIAGARRGQTVSYLDGDHFNLRRDNLVLTEGFATGRERAAIKRNERRAARRAARLH